MGRVTGQHEWVKIVITPIHVIDDPAVSSEPVIFSSEDDEIEAAEYAQYGCSKCDTSLDSDSVNTLCPGAEEEREIEILGQTPEAGPDSR
jgi:hypothetical protein